MQTATKYSNSDYQRDVSRFVEQNVYYCVSSLIYELAQDEKYQEDLLPILVQDDWETPVRKEFSGLDDDDKQQALGYMNISELDELDHDDFAELGDFLRVDPYQNEALEHWIISDWLAARLAEHSEIVTTDFMGLTIWGRTTSGQSISIDGVICDIYDELNND